MTIVACPITAKYRVKTHFLTPSGYRFSYFYVVACRNAKKVVTRPAVMARKCFSFVKNLYLLYLNTFLQNYFLPGLEVVSLCFATLPYTLSYTDRKVLRISLCMTDDASA